MEIVEEHVENVDRFEFVERLLKVLDFLFDDKLKAEIEETKENHDKLML